MQTIKSSGSLVNMLSPDQTVKVPQVGDGATVLMHSDRHAATIIEVSKSGKRVVIQHDKATRIDKNGFSEAQTYTFEANPEGRTDAYTLRKNGSWVREGEPMNNGTRIGIGYRSEYYDFSF